MHVVGEVEEGGVLKLGQYKFFIFLYLYNFPSDGAIRKSTHHLFFKTLSPDYS